MITAKWPTADHLPFPPKKNIFRGMGFTILIWLAFLVGVGYVINRWGTDGGNAIWLIGLALIVVGNIIGLFFSVPGG